MYDIITDENPITLARIINQKIEDGWQLVGGVSVSTVARHVQITTIFAQAIRKDTEQ